MLRWTEQQRAMLKAMGVQQFWPQGAEENAVPSEALPQAVRVAPTMPSPVSALASLPASALTPVSAPVSEVPRPDAGELAWPALIATVSACRACGLCNSRKQAVVGVGHPQAQWMLVGEAPGEQEDIQGEPFVGRAGQLLDRMLTANGLTREAATPAQQVYIANVIKCRPPGNRNPTPEEVQQCEPYLARQVQLVKPKLLVAMGRFAAHALLKTSDPIGRLRGRVHTYEGTPLVVTYHPAYLLRNPADKALAWDDWCLAREAMAGLR